MSQELTSHAGQELPQRDQQLLRETQALTARLAVVNEVSQAVTAALDIDAILEVVVEQTKWVLDYDRCRIALRNRDGVTYRQWWLYNPAYLTAGTPEARTGAEVQSCALGEGLAGWVISHSQVLRLNGDEELAPRGKGLEETVVDTDTGTSVLALPLTGDGETFGSLIFESQQPDAYHDADVRLGTILAAQIAVAIRNAQLLEESRRRAEHIEALNTITRAITASLDIDEVFQTFAVQTRRLIEHDRLSIALLDDDGETLKAYAVAADGDSTLSSGVELPIEGTAVGWVVANRQPLLQPDTQSARFAEDEALLQNGIRSYVDVPLSVKGDVIGTLNVGCRRPNAFGPADVETLTEIANQVAVSIQSQRLHAETQRFAEKLERRVKERTHELEEVQAQLIAAERFAAAGRLAAAIAHEINNPMQSIRSGLELLARRVPDSDDVSRQYIDILLEEQARVSGIIQQMLDFYRPPQRGRKPTVINDVIRSVLRLIEVNRHEVHVVTQLHPELPLVRANADQLKQVFLNLALNAIEAMSNKGRLTITTAGSGDDVVIKVIDEGPGIAARDIGHIFEPFYTTRPDGLGIGLSVSRSLIEAHGGAISVRSREGEGATFEIRLPASEETGDG
ncbi:MAG: GAF domain-containing protein [Anaerolineae bacterium]